MPALLTRMSRGPERRLGLAHHPDHLLAPAHVGPRMAHRDAALRGQVGARPLDLLRIA
jgi:hypothetical protein